jgi:quinol monooxygenase YgiN
VLTPQKYKAVRRGPAQRAHRLAAGCHFALTAAAAQACASLLSSWADLGVAHLQAIDAGRFAIFDAFRDAAGREAHLAGQVAAALMERANELFAKAPSIEKVDVLADKLPS